MTIDALIWVAFGYLLGSVPFGLVLSKVMNLGDIRTIGSGNIGATNVLRTGNKKAAFLTLLLDGGKGAIAVLIAQYFDSPVVALVALSAFIGHCYPVWLKFKGGKGVATYFGTALALAWPVALAAMVSWIALAAMFRYSSLAAMFSVGMAPIYAMFMGYPGFVFVGYALAGLVYWRHRDNIKRLRAGTESKIGAKKS